MVVRPITLVAAAATSLYATNIAIDRLIPPPDPNAPLVELVDLTFDPAANAITYTRTVNSERIVYAPWEGSVISEVTQRHVPECEVRGRAPYGPPEIEPETQTFTFDQFYNPPECRAALICGDYYYLSATVSPPVGRPSAITSQGFRWECDE